MNNLTGDHL